MFSKIFQALLVVVVFVALSESRVTVNPSPDGTRVNFEFALQFTCTPINGVNHAYAGSQLFNTTVPAKGLPIFTVTPETGGNPQQVLWLSDLTHSVGSRWGEEGNITFSSGNTLFFHSNGLSGIQLGNFPDLNYGAITYVIQGGTGLFDGAYGMMVDTFVSTNPSDPNAPFAINAWGFVWINTSSGNAAATAGKIAANFA